MTYRATDRDIDRACEALTGHMHALGLLHPQSTFRRTGAYGRTGVDVTGGPFYGTGAEPADSRDDEVGLPRAAPRDRPRRRARTAFPPDPDRRPAVTAITREYLDRLDAVAARTRANPTVMVLTVSGGIDPNPPEGWESLGDMEARRAQVIASVPDLIAALRHVLDLDPILPFGQQYDSMEATRAFRDGASAQHQATLAALAGTQTDDGAVRPEVTASSPGPAPSSPDRIDEWARVIQSAIGCHEDCMDSEHHDAAVRIARALDAYDRVPRTEEARTGPHSRACGIKRHDHGTECHSNCPTCRGSEVPR